MERVKISGDESWDFARAIEKAVLENELKKSSKMKIYKNTTMSEEFNEIVAEKGTRRTECEACARVYFAAELPGFEEGELEELLELSEDDPDFYINTFDKVVTFVKIDGYDCVCQCNCGFVKKWERSIWDAKDKIMEYIKAKEKKD